MILPKTFAGQKFIQPSYLCITETLKFLWNIYFHPWGKDCHRLYVIIKTNNSQDKKFCPWEQWEKQAKLSSYTVHCITHKERREPRDNQLMFILHKNYLHTHTGLSQAKSLHSYSRPTSRHIWRLLENGMGTEMCYNSDVNKRERGRQGEVPQVLANHWDRKFPTVPGHPSCWTWILGLHPQGIQHCWYESTLLNHKGHASVAPIIIP